MAMSLESDASTTALQPGLLKSQPDALLGCSWHSELSARFCSLKGFRNKVRPTTVTGSARVTWRHKS